MSDAFPPAAEHGGEPLLDTFLREAVPEIKLALGDLIDRDNQRIIPDRYARLLPETMLVVTLREDAATAVSSIAAELEAELTDSCMRHGSLYDREYQVKLRVGGKGSPLFRVSVRKTNEPEPEAFRPPAPAPPPPPRPEPVAPQQPQAPSYAPTTAPGADHGDNATVIAVRPVPSQPAEPAVDPDATRIDGAPAPAAGPSRWDAERFTLVVEDEEGEEKERFPVPAAMTTVGRQTDKAELRADVLITDAPHVSRRQLALVWAPRGESPGFTVYNLGLNPLHVGEREVAGANRGKGALELDELMMDHTEWVAPGTAMAIGEHGPVLRIVDAKAEREDDAGDAGAAAAAPEVEMDPDATRFG